MKYCYTCGKALGWGEEFTANGIVQCENCMRAQLHANFRAQHQETPAQPNPQANHAQPMQAALNSTVYHEDSWSGILKAAAVIELIAGCIAALVIGVSLMETNAAVAIGVIFGGIAGAVVAAAPMMVIANMAERQEEMRVLLAQQLALQKAQIQQNNPPQE